jgi:murein DD-endopeptidase MepM/ murein hydrolase activator NlpD
LRHPPAKGTSAAAVGSFAITVLKGPSLGLAAWVFSLLAWLGLEIGLGGRSPRIVCGLVGAAAGASFGWVAAWASTRRANRRGEYFRRLLLGAAAVAALILTALYGLLTGPRDLARYPDARGSPYRLPWRGGVTRLCVQSNRAIVSHRGREEFAYDFAMPVDSQVCAARSGIVKYVEVGQDGRGRDAANNVLIIDHKDGTFGWYLHLRKGGSYVTPGQRVRQGERIAASGNVGISMLPHLHFHVTDREGRLLPVAFTDVGSDSGIPRMFKRYTSGNADVGDGASGQEAGG